MRCAARRPSGQPPDGRRADLRPRADARSRSRACRRRRSGSGSRTSRALLLFIWIVNLLGFIPLPLTGEHTHSRASSADVRHLRGDVVDLGDARARAHDLDLHARRGHPPQRAGALLQELDPGRPEADAPADRPARDPRAVHAPDLAAVRLFANMLAGHMLILIFIGLVFVLTRCPSSSRSCCSAASSSTSSRS